MGSFCCAQIGIWDDSGFRFVYYEVYGFAVVRNAMQALIPIRLTPPLFSGHVNVNGASEVLTLSF